MQMILRPAAHSDFNAIAQLHIESWRDAYRYDFPQEFFGDRIEQELGAYWNAMEIQSNDIVLVAQEKGLIGFIAVWCRPGPYIDNLHVRPARRSGGIGATLMQAALKNLIQNGFDTAYLWVFENNRKAIRFYERMGGVRKERELIDIFGHQIPSRKIQWDNLRNHR